MNHWRRDPDERAAAWRLLESLALDVALVQEQQ
jgi:hypothetical protein